MSVCPQVWPEDQFPLQQVGRLVLDQNIDSQHNENEQIAFSPGRLVPGAAFCLRPAGCCGCVGLRLARCQQVTTASNKTVAVG